MMLCLAALAIAVGLGGTGTYIRHTVLSQPFLEGQTLMETTARYHVWPWPLKLAILVNLPAFMVADLVSMPLAILSKRLATYLSTTLRLVLVVLLWLKIGKRLETRSSE